MFDHVTIRASDREASRAFYAAALGEPTYESEWFVEWGDFSLVQGEPTTRLDLAFAAARSDRPARHDPDGNSVAVIQEPTAAGNRIARVSLAARDVAAARAFWETAAPVVGIRLERDTPELIRYVCDAGTLSIAAGDEPSRNVHLAFPAADNETVDRFHRAATDAGFRDNGAPGERAVYHPGYYGAFALDPDGNNIETVCHNR